MAKYQLHYAGSTFELPDAQLAVQLRKEVDAVMKSGGGRLMVKTTTGIVIIYVANGVALAISGLSEVESAG